MLSGKRPGSVRDVPQPIALWDNEPSRPSHGTRRVEMRAKKCCRKNTPTFCMTLDGVPLRHPLHEEPLSQKTKVFGVAVI